MSTCLIAPAGWEERYVEGVKRDVNELKPSAVFVPYSSQYAARTQSARNSISSFVRECGYEYEEFIVDYGKPVAIYQFIGELCEKHAVSSSQKVRINITTAPRDVVWYLFHFLRIAQRDIDISYDRPLDYTSDYLSRDASAPTLILKRSGIVYPDKPSCILALSGFDEERLQQVRRRYEPKLMLIGTQTGEQLDNKQRVTTLEGSPREIEVFDFDSYDTSDASLELLVAKVKPVLPEYNVLAVSLGPKPGAITLFRLTELLPEVALVYIGARDYNPEYSVGYDGAHRILTALQSNTVPVGLLSC